MSFELGDMVPLSVRITDVGGQPANAGQVTVTVTLPDGTTSATGPIAPTGTGVYDHDYVTVQAGRHGVYWLATGANASAFRDAFDVVPADGGDFISLADLKNHMDKAGDTDDAELTGFISAACQMVVDRVGHVSPTTVADTRHCPRRVIVLEQHPIASVTEVEVPGGDVIPPADPDSGVDGWVVDAGAGVLRHTSFWPYGLVRVIYRAGRTPVPGNVRLAALELAAHLWRSSQLNSGGGRPALGDSETTVVVGSSYALPTRVRELLGLGKHPTNEYLVG